MEELLQKDSIFRVGKVISVEGRIIKIEVDKLKNGAHLLYQGQLLRNIGVNSYIKITKGFIKIIGKVDGEYIVEDKHQASKNYTNEKKKIKRQLQVSLLGFFGNIGFERGVKELPLINNECYLLDRNEFESVHDFVKKDDIPITLGKLTHENIQPIRIGVNDLFASHIGIFGNTGSGKSYSLAKIYNSLFSIFGEKENFRKNARFLLFDFNGEYNSETSITNHKKVFNLSTRPNEEKDKIPFNEEDLLNIDLFSIMANATEKTQKPFLKRALKFYDNVNQTNQPTDYFKNILRKRIKSVLQMADKEKAFLLLDYFKEILPRKFDDFETEIDLTSDLTFHNKSAEFIHEEVFLRSHPDEIEETLIYNQVDEYLFPTNFIKKVNNFIYLQLVTDVLNNRAENNHISPAINKLKSFQKEIEEVIEIGDQETDFWDGNFFSIINLNRTTVKIKKMLPLLISYKLYTEHKKQKEKKNNKESKSLNIIIDEAHNILSYISQRESETWKDYRLETFEEIIKEGRKFGVFLTIASQRPSDISATIISQLHNFFLHRLINNNDINAIERTVSYLDRLSFESLPILATGTCILAGISAQVPVMIDIGKINEEFEPDNKTIRLTDNWI